MLSTHTYIPGVRHKGRECVVVPRGRTGLGVTAVAPRVPLQAVLQEPPRVDRCGEHEHEQHVKGEAGLWTDERGSFRCQISTCEAAGICMLQAPSLKVKLLLHLQLNNDIIYFHLF